MAVPMLLCNWNKHSKEQKKMVSPTEREREIEAKKEYIDFINTRHRLVVCQFSSFIFHLLFILIVSAFCSCLYKWKRLTVNSKCPLIDIDAYPYINEEVVALYSVYTPNHTQTLYNIYNQKLGKIYWAVFGIILV